MKFALPEPGKFSGTSVDLAHVGHVGLTQVLSQNRETALYLTDHHGVLVKLFDLACGKPDEISYGPYAAFQTELANFEDVLKSDPLRPLVPCYYGAQVDYQKKFAFIAMEFLQGTDLKSWCEDLCATDPDPEQELDLRRTLYEMLLILEQFHRHGFLLLDFKPDNLVRLPGGTIRLVDLGALFAPRHAHQLESFVYSATPDHSEVLIDASNLQAGLPPTEASDVFAAGVALFELVTGQSRLTMDPATAHEILANTSLFVFQDSQTKDVWRAYPHLREELPLLRTQLEEHHILFADIWHLLKAYLATKVPDWDAIPSEQHDQILLTAGTTFILEQLPPAMAWLAGPIARATTLRSLRLKHITDLLPLVASPVPDPVREDLEQHNRLVACLRQLELPVDFVQRLNTWDVRLDASGSHYAVAGPIAARELGDTAQFIFLKKLAEDGHGQHYWDAVDEFAADERDGLRLTLREMSDDYRSWIGT